MTVSRSSSILFRVAFFVSALLLTACATPVPSAAPAVVYEDYRVGAPDQLRVKVLPDPVIEDELTVRPDGKVSVQLIGDVQAAGRTPSEISEEIEKRIKRYKRGAKATVSIVNAASSTITVLGEVRQPGTFQMSKQTRVSEALGTSSGATTFARINSIRVLRGTETGTDVIRVDLAAIRGGDLSTNIVLHSGDLVYVPPTVLAKIGYAFQALLFPLQPLLGIANSAVGSAVVGN